MILGREDLSLVSTKDRVHLATVRKPIEVVAAVCARGGLTGARDVKATIQGNLVVERLNPSTLVKDLHVICGADRLSSGPWSDGTAATSY